MSSSRTEAWEYMRSGGEVFLSDGIWYLTSAEACRFAARHPEVFSSSLNGAAAACPVPLYIPNAIDPPEHARYRRLIDPMFSPQAITDQEPELRRRMNALIDRVIDSGRCEVMADIAEVYPTEVFTLMFGLPQEDREKLVGYAHATMAGASNPELGPAAEAAGVELAEYIKEFVAKKRVTPGDDIISKIIATAGLNEDEIIALCFNVIQGGLDTVTSAIGFMMNYLATNPAIRQSLIEDPELVSPFIEEILRLESVAPFLPRFTTQEVEVCGTSIPAQAVVYIGYAVANRDPDEFEQPNDVDLTQSRRSHFGFGAGNHRCLGSHLARRELKVLFEEFHRRIPEYSLAPGAEPKVRWPALVSCLDTVPLTFTPGGTR